MMFPSVMAFSLGLINQKRPDIYVSNIEPLSIDDNTFSISSAVGNHKIVEMTKSTELVHKTVLVSAQGNHKIVPMIKVHEHLDKAISVKSEQGKHKLVPAFKEAGVEDTSIAVRSSQGKHRIRDGLLQSEETQDNRVVLVSLIGPHKLVNLE